MRTQRISGQVSHFFAAGRKIFVCKFTFMFHQASAYLRFLCSMKGPGKNTSTPPWMGC